MGLALVSLALAAQPAGAAGCRYTKFATLPVQLKGPRVLIEGSINDKPQIMMVDTGSQATWLPRKTAEQLSLALRRSSRLSVGFGGESQVYTALIEDIKIGKVDWQKINLDVYWEAAFPYGAVIGATFLFQNDVEFALQDKEIRLFDPSGCDNAFLAYWDKSAVEIRLDEAGSNDLRPTVEITVNGKKLRALIDSGSPISSIDLAAAAKLGVTPELPGVIAVGARGGVGVHKHDTWMALFDSFEIGEETISHPKILMFDMYGSLSKDEHARWASTYAEGQPSVILGEDFLRAHRVLFAMSQHKLYLSYIGGQVFDRPAEDKTN